MSCHCKGLIFFSYQQHTSSHFIEKIIKLQAGTCGDTVLATRVR